MCLVDYHQFILPRKMDPTHMMFVALGVLLNFQLQFQQSFIVLVILMAHHQQAFLGLALAVRRRRRRNRHRIRNQPWAWTLPRPAESWFEIHFHDRNIPGDYFRRQLRMKRNTFQALVGILGHRIVRENTRFRDCIPPEKVLALGLYRLAHGNSYVSIGPVFNVGKSTTVQLVAYLPPSDSRLFAFEVFVMVSP